MSVIDELFRRLAAAPATALLLDYDGTLAPFRVERDRATPWPGVALCLDELLDMGARVVIVTGRPAKQIPDLLGTNSRPEIWGSHGRERWWPDGRYELAPVPAEAGRGLAKAGDWLASHGLGAHAEPKPAGLALHWRGMEAKAAAALEAEARMAWEPLAAAHGLTCHDFDGGLELRVPGRDKGHAVQAILKSLPADAVVAYLGDDYTDEDAFLALGRRGLSVLVSRSPRPTAARVTITPPQELLEFLERWIEGLRRAA